MSRPEWRADCADVKQVANGNATWPYSIQGDQMGSASMVTTIMGTVMAQQLHRPHGLLQAIVSSCSERL